MAAHLVHRDETGHSHCAGGADGCRGSNRLGWLPYGTGFQAADMKTYAILLLNPQDLLQNDLLITRVMARSRHYHAL